MKRKRLFFLLMACLTAVSFSTAVLAGDTGDKPKPIMIRGKIGKVDCDGATITITEVKGVGAARGKALPDITVKLTQKTKMSGVKECREITPGAPLLAAFVEGDQGKVATELILPRSQDLEKIRKGRAESQPKLEKEGPKQGPSGEKDQGESKK